MQRDAGALLSTVVAMIAMAFNLSCFHATKSVPSVASRDCVSWQSLDVNSKKSLVLVSCSGLDPETWDTGRILGKPECVIGDAQIVGEREPGDVLDSFAEVHSIGKDTRPVVTLRPEPRVAEKMAGAGAAPAIACDTELARVYVGNSFLGYFVAYRPDGRELWRLSLPGFQTVIGQPLEDRTPRGMSHLIESDGSILGKLVSMSSFLAVSYRNKGRYYELIVHRSGVPIAAIGPWDGVLIQATNDGWVFDAGGEAAHKSWSLPNEELVVRLTAGGPEVLIDHFLSWNLPHPQDTELTWRKCEGDNRFGRLDLGPRFDPNMDEVARQIHDGLGADWARKIFEDDVMTSVLRRGDLPFHEWKAKVRKALLDAGADVDCVNYAREHGLFGAASR